MKAIVFSVACIGYCVYRYIDMREKEKKFEIFRKSMEEYRESLIKERTKIEKNIDQLDASKKNKFVNIQTFSSINQLKDPHFKNQDPQSSKRLQ